MNGSRQSPVTLPQRWSPLDLGLHTFLAVSPLALGLWVFSLAPLVGGNLLVAATLAGGVAVVGAVVVGSLAASRPWTGGDYAWQSRLLGTRAGGALALASWWIAVAALAPVFGNVLLAVVLDPILANAGWNGLASWFRARDGVFMSSLLAIVVATAFVGLGMRRAAIAQRALVLAGTVALLTVLVLLFTGGPGEFRAAFDEQAAEVYEASPLASSQISEIGNLDARVAELEPVDSLRLVPLVLLFALWIGWAGPLVGEIRVRSPQVLRLVLFRAAVASTLMTLLLFVAIGRGITWDLWNEANNLYWGTLYGTTPATPLAAWPSPVVFATWLTDSALLQSLVLAGMAAWVLGWIATLFLAATRVLVAAAADGVLPSSVARMTGDSVPLRALGLLVVPACGLAAVDAYWDDFAAWSSTAVVALALTTVGTGIAAVVAFRGRKRALAVASAVYTAIVLVVASAWIVDPVYGMRALGPLAFLAAALLLAALVSAAAGRRQPATTAG